MFSGNPCAMFHGNAHTQHYARTKSSPCSLTSSTSQLDEILPGMMKFTTARLQLVSGAASHINKYKANRFGKMKIIFFLNSKDTSLKQLQLLGLIKKNDLKKNKTGVLRGKNEKCERSKGLFGKEMKSFKKESVLIFHQKIVERGFLSTF